MPSIPGSGGSAGRVPGLSDDTLAASTVIGSPDVGTLTTTRPGPSRLATPWTTVAPASTSRSTATRSSQSSVACTEIRSATGVQLEGHGYLARELVGATGTRPAGSTARTIILVGMQP